MEHLNNPSNERFYSIRLRRYVDRLRPFLLAIKAGSKPRKAQSSKISMSFQIEEGQGLCGKNTTADALCQETSGQGHGLPVWAFGCGASIHAGILLLAYWWKGFLLQKLCILKQYRQ